jgi:hypothetical protein
MSHDDWVEFARTATHGWHEEETKYPYDNPHFNDAWGHFTQMVWRNSSSVGCAVGHCPDNVDFPGRFYCCECHGAEGQGLSLPCPHRLHVLRQ